MSLRRTVSRMLEHLWNVLLLDRACFFFFFSCFSLPYKIASLLTATSLQLKKKKKKARDHVALCRQGEQPLICRSFCLSIFRFLRAFFFFAF